MSGIIQSWIYWWNLLRNLFNVGRFSITGTFILGPGIHEISVPVDFPNPQEVFLSATETDGNCGGGGVATCIGDLNWVASRMLVDNFVLYANITSASCTVDYIITYMN
jgi:hypothetical protein